MTNQIPTCSIGPEGLNSFPCPLAQSVQHSFLAKSNNFNVHNGFMKLTKSYPYCIICTNLYQNTQGEDQNCCHLMFKNVLVSDQGSIS